MPVRKETEKWRSFFEDDVYNVVFCHPNLPIYQIKPEKRRKKI